MSRSVFINATNSFFPNEPVGNEAIENVLGTYKDRPSKCRRVVLESNQIKTRYYAIDPATRKPTHTNSQMTAEAVLGLFTQNPELNLKDVQLLCCGTSSPDLLIPAHGQMVQGNLAEFSGEVVTTAGVCCSSMSALKMAYLSVLAGDTSAAVVTGSEVPSKSMRAEFFESESDSKVEELKKNPMIAFEHEFLRWMLSDGAGAFYLSNQALPGKTNLKINWIEGRSYANEVPVCMYAGGNRETDGTVTPWKDLRLLEGFEKNKYVMNLGQDVRLLKEKIATYTVERPLTELKKKRGLKPGDYAWFVPHFSSDFFREILFSSLTQVDFQIPYDRWFTSLYEKGNVGSASVFVSLDELIRTKKLNPGEKILCYNPESARFSAYYMELEVV